MSRQDALFRKAGKWHTGSTAYDRSGMAITEKLRRLDASTKIALLRQCLLRMPKTPALLYELAEALSANGEDRESANVFRQAFQLDPAGSVWPCGAGWDLAPNAITAMRDRALSLIKNGVVFSPVIAALAIAEARLGNETEVRRLIDFNRFFSCCTVRTPRGFCQSGFNSLLAAEIKSDLKFYDEPEQRSIRKGWRNNGVIRSRLPASRALSRVFRHHVEQYIAGLPGDPDHPFLASRPSGYVLEGWAVVSDGASHHQSHIHPRAWVSGVYYVVRPPLSREADTDRGWLRVGPPGRVGNLAGWDTRLVEPEPGTIVLMPGYFHHHTAPMGIDEERICVAFDVVPVEIAAAGSNSDY
jgi:hypothetical protein